MTMRTCGNCTACCRPLPILELQKSIGVWGDAVNTAARMESSGEPGRINISGRTYDLVKDFFDFDYRGKIEAKNKGKIDMYFLNNIKKEFSADESGRLPNEKFWKLYNKQFC
jgi:hypothetical protein